MASMLALRRRGCYSLARMNALGLGKIREWFEGLGELTLLALEVVRSAFMGRVTGRDLIYQLYFIGIKSQSVVFITGGFTGLVLCAQTTDWDLMPMK